ncbi:hypothetical protein J057_02155 [Marinobacter nanhaiticus D15-8W]|uniref:NADH-quinone oxidoreductase subunit D domain-containing protein n=2 Tax=Marinobacter TaxID=2742 RepID=N6W1R9_9GAMM|nr:hypothetical protein J057_02155 [Marinobacter nanhaiticus D15-8W]
MKWLQKQAGRAPLPVFPIIGRGGEATLDALHLSPGVEITASPRHARALVVLGTVEPYDHDALKRVHDQVPVPRISLWCGNTPVPEELRSSAIKTTAPEELVERARVAYRKLISGEHAGDINLCLDEPPAPWKGLGDGHGGEGMMGGKPYGRPMAMPEDDLRDGLQLDPLDFTLGPFSSLLPPGMSARIKLHGDVIADFEVISKPYPRTLPDVFYQAQRRPVPLADLELARAGYHLRRLSHALQINGLGAYATRLRRRAAHLRPDQPKGELAPASVWRSLFRSAGAHQGVVTGDSVARLRGSAARAAGANTDSRSQDPAYTSLGFQPVVQHSGTCGARWKQWLDEADQALKLALSAHKNEALSSPSHIVESPLGPLTKSDPPVDCSDLLPSLLVGLEWSEAMSVIASLDLAAVDEGAAPNETGTADEGGAIS